MSSYRVILADDHNIFRQGLKYIIGEMSGIEVIGEAKDGLELLELLKKSSADMVILDISMPNLRGIEAIYEIKRISPKVKILVFTMHKEREYLFQTLDAGADAYMIKENTKESLLAGIDAVRHNKIYICPLVKNGLGDERTGDYFQKKKSYLSPRERSVLKLISEGKTNKEVADILFISPRTVEHHRENIKKKLGVTNSADMIKYAVHKAYL